MHHCPMSNPSCFQMHHQVSCNSFYFRHYFNTFEDPLVLVHQIQCRISKQLNQQQQLHAEQKCTFFQIYLEKRNIFPALQVPIHVCFNDQFNMFFSIKILEQNESVFVQRFLILLIFNYHFKKPLSSSMISLSLLFPFQ